MKYDDLNDLQIELMCAMEGDVNFSEPFNVAFSSYKRFEAYSEYESYMVDIYYDGDTEEVTVVDIN